MGNPEFSTSLAQFNQDQLDDIQATAQLIQAAVQAIQNTDIAALNNKVGTSADGIAVLTLFGKLAKIINDTSGLSGKIGVATDAAGDWTLFGYQKYTHARIGDNSALGGDPNLFGQIRYAHKLLEGSGSVLAKIGNWGDPAPAGTLYSGQTYITDRIVEVRNNVDKLTVNLPKIAMMNVTTSGATVYQIVNITGRGIVRRISLYLSGGVSASNLDFTLYVDSVPLEFLGVNAAVTAGSLSGSTNRIDVFPEASFDLSLSLHVKNNGASTALSGWVDYGLF